MQTKIHQNLAGLVVVLSAAAIAHPSSVQALPAAAANATTSADRIPRLQDQVNPSQSAQSLMTQPKTVKEMFGVGTIAPSDRLEQAEADIPSAVSQSPQPVNASDAMANPADALQRFLKQTPSAPKPMQPLEFFKLPGMDSGMKLDVWQF